MATARPFAYNTGAGITGTDQVGALAVGTPTDGFATTGLEWWNGPDEDLGYVIAQTVPSDTQPTEIPGVFATVGFFRSDALTDPSFINIANAVAGASGGGPFASGSAAKTWLNTNGYWTSYAGATGASGAFVVTITQVGPDVVWTGSGGFNLTSLTLVGSAPITSGFSANQAIWIAGADLISPGSTGQQYGGASLTYPTTFASGAQTGGPSSYTGSMFGVLPGGVTGRTITVPDGYVSGNIISGSTTYANQTISSMGLSGGTYTWSWGSAENASSLVMTIS
jgi:hypothetical protein